MNKWKNKNRMKKWWIQYKWVKQNNNETQQEENVFDAIYDRPSLSDYIIPTFSLCVYIWLTLFIELYDNNIFIM